MFQFTGGSLTIFPLTALTIAHILVSLKNLNLRQEPNESGFCLLAEFIYVRGHWTVLIAYSSKISLHTDSYYGPTAGLFRCGNS